MKTVYFVRHGESKANAERRFLKDEEENPLTEQGQKQAAFIAERCTHFPVECIIASSMLRTQQTAAVISDRIGKPVIISDFFIERRSPEAMFGLSLDDPKLERINKEWLRGFFEKDVRYADGDNFDDLLRRANKALAFLAAKDESHIVVVTHGFFSRMLLARILFGPALTPDEFLKVIHVFQTSNTGLTLAEYKPLHGGAEGLEPTDWIIRAWNDHAHLG